MKPEWSNLRLSTRARVCKPATGRARRDGTGQTVRYVWVAEKRTQ